LTIIPGEGEARISDKRVVNKGCLRGQHDGALKRQAGPKSGGRGGSQRTEKTWAR